MHRLQCDELQDAPSPQESPAAPKPRTPEKVGAFHFMSQHHLAPVKTEEANMQGNLSRLHGPFVTWLTGHANLFSAVATWLKLSWHAIRPGVEVRMFPRIQRLDGMYIVQARLAPNASV